MEEIIFSLITYSGEAKSLLMEGIEEAKIGNFIEANKKMKDSEKKLQEAHKIQTKLIQKEAGGEEYKTSLLLVHAQDHLMNALLLKKIAKEFIDLYKKVEG